LRLRLSVVTTAERHIRKAARWWRDNRPAAPDLFTKELARAFDLIASNPAIAPLAPDAPAPEIRRFHLARIHYHLYYQVVGDTVEVLAVWHMSRGQGPKL
jgi:plasmid stabilization system protein ParE